MRNSSSNNTFNLNSIFPWYHSKQPLCCNNYQNIAGHCNSYFTCTKTCSKFDLSHTILSQLPNTLILTRKIS